MCVCVCVCECVNVCAGVYMCVMCVCVCVCVLVSGTMLLFHVHSFCTNINDDCATLHDSPSRVGWSGPHSASVSSTDDLAACIENESVRYNLRALGPPTYILVNVKQGPHTWDSPAVRRTQPSKAHSVVNLFLGNTAYKLYMHICNENMENCII